MRDLESRLELQKDRFKRAIEKTYNKNKPERQDTCVEWMEKCVDASSAGDASTNKIALIGAFGYLGILFAIAMFVLYINQQQVEVKARQEELPLAAETVDAVQRAVAQVIISGSNTTHLYLEATSRINSTMSKIRARARCLGDQQCLGIEMHLLYDESAHATASAINSTISLASDLYDESSIVTGEYICRTVLR
jgi:hypothetical protein